MSSTPTRSSPPFAAASLILSFVFATSCGGRSSLDEQAALAAGTDASATGPRDAALDAACAETCCEPPASGRGRPSFQCAAAGTPCALPRSSCETASGGDASTCAPPEPGGWSISSAGLSTACKSVSECQAVYVGDNACETPVNGGGNCPNAAISMASYTETYEPEYEGINAACEIACGAGSILCATPGMACNGTLVNGVPGTCELSSGILLRTCSPTDGLAVTFAFAPSLTCTPTGTLPMTVDTLTLYEVPSGPTMITFTPSPPDGKGEAHACRAGVCVDATLVILTLSQLTPGTASGSYELHFTDGSIDSGAFVANVCANTTMCG